MTEDNIIESHGKPTQEAVMNMLARLNARDARIMRMIFGIDMRAHTHEEVGTHFDITPEAVREIEVKALRKLRHPAHGLQ